MSQLSYLGTLIEDASYIKLGLAKDKEAVKVDAIIVLLDNLTDEAWRLQEANIELKRRNAKLVPDTVYLVKEYTDVVFGEYRQTTQTKICNHYFKTEEKARAFINGYQGTGRVYNFCEQITFDE